MISKIIGRKCFLVYKDNVMCCNCDFDVLVDIGQEECPGCEFTGALAWKPEEKQEVVYC